MTVRMLVLPLDGGRPVTKSRVICDHGWLGTCRGQSNPARGLVEILLGAQVEQATMNARVLWATRSVAGAMKASR